VKKISWKDEDGDKVRISCDDELKISLTEMKGKVNKFSVDLYLLSNNDKSKDKGDNPGLFFGECKNTCSGFCHMSGLQSL